MKPIDEPCPECGAQTFLDEGARVDRVNLLHSPAECSECHREMIEVGRKLRNRLIESMAAALSKHEHS